jgi:hypothetical protein
MATKAEVTQAVTDALNQQSKLVGGIVSWEAYMEALLDAARKGARTGVSDQRLHKAANEAMIAVFTFAAQAGEGPIHDIVRQVIEESTPAPPS